MTFMKGRALLVSVVGVSGLLYREGEIQVNLMRFTWHLTLVYEVEIHLCRRNDTYCEFKKAIAHL